MSINPKKFDEAKVVDIFADLSEEEKIQADLLAEIAMQIHSRRIEMKMTQAEFARFINVSQTMVSKWESGDYNFTIEKIAYVFSKIGLSLSFTFSEKEKPESVKSTVLAKQESHNYSICTTQSSTWFEKTATKSCYSFSI